MTLAIEIMGILAMCTFMFIAIWGFILLHRLYNQIKYTNYLLEKLSEHVFMLSHKTNTINKGNTDKDK